VDGLAMFVNQAAAQFELWTGVPAPRELMRAVVEARLKR
jgi:shikimate 5-dehydrogenase